MLKRHAKREQGRRSRRAPSIPRLSALLAALALAATGVAACGGDDDSSGDSTASGGAQPTGIGKQIQEILGTPTGEEALAGVEIDVGAVLPLSGGGSYYGKVDKNGIELARKHIEAAGGPKFNVTYKDNKSGDTEAGAQVTRELGIDGVPLSLTSFSAVLGSQLPGLEQYKIFTMDGGGGAPAGLQGKPFFYGMRAVLPTDMFGAVFQYIDSEMPDVGKKVTFVTWDVGADQLAGYREQFDANLEEFGFENNGFERAAIGETDFGSLIEKLRKQDSDVILLGVYGLDSANFMKQYVNSGLDAKVFGFEITPDAVKLAGKAYEDIIMAGDSFAADAPDNEWAELFAKEYQKTYKSTPDFYPANYYEDLFALWQLARQVKAAGGDVNDGEAYVEALNENPRFQSLYGTDTPQVGSMELDTESHTLSHRPMAMYSFPKVGEPPKKLASFDIGGADFKKVGD